MIHNYSKHDAQAEMMEGNLPQYNTDNDNIELRGYGRNIQKMVDHCLEIEDRGERTRCAKTIIKTMALIRKGYDQNTLWDHLYFMSGEKLDIDYPNGYVPERLGRLTSTAQKVEYHMNKPLVRHYGNNIQQAIKEALAMEDLEARYKLAILIANQMKRCYVLFNKDTITDNKIFDDLREFSNGRLDLREGEVKLVDAQTVLNVQNKPANAQQSGGSGKKKKKKKK